MRSPDSPRAVAEAILRGALVATLFTALMRSLAPPAVESRPLATTVRALPPALAEATRSAHVGSIGVQVDSMPSATERAWLAALRHAGVDVRWTGQPPAIAVQVERSREPESRVRVSVVADSGAPLSLSDSAGALDSLVAGSRGATLEAPSVVGVARAARGRFHASAVVPQPGAPRAVLVLGRAGWEGKFVAAALQEAGWTVRSRQPSAPGVNVADPGVLPIDTARYSAVVALDSTAADLAPAMARFVAQGGGLLLAGDTPGLPAFASLAPARTGARVPGRILLDADSVTRAALPVRPLAAIRGDAVRLEGTPAAVTVAVRRALLGRVMTVGYDESWRWRMMGGAGGTAAHRDWWSRAVGMVAREPSAPLPSGAEAAPMAALVSALGPSSAPAASDGTTHGDRLYWYLLVFSVLALLAETASRRFRGAS